MSTKIKSGTKFGDYEVGSILGEGSFGTVYGATFLPSNMPVAMKIVTRKSVAQDQLCNEYLAYERLKGMVWPEDIVRVDYKKPQGTESWSDISASEIQTFFKFPRVQQEPRSQHLGGFPQSFWCSDVGEFYVFAMERLGPSLEDLMKAMPVKRFSLKCVLLLAEQLLASIFKLHSAGIVSCDIKPQNIVIGHGQGGQSQIYLLDLGISRRFWLEECNKHVPYYEYPDMNGTPRFAGINSHSGKENSRRDDLESLAYLLMYFVRGFLPWQGIDANHKQFEMIHEMKCDLLDSDYLKEMDAFFRRFLEYTRTLTFQQKPDYIYLRDLIYECAQKHGFQGVSSPITFDWVQMFRFCNADGTDPNNKAAPIPPSSFNVERNHPNSSSLSPTEAIPISVKSREQLALFHLRQQSRRRNGN